MMQVALEDFCLFDCKRSQVNFVFNVIEYIRVKNFFYEEFGISKVQKIEFGKSLIRI